MRIARLGGEPVRWLCRRDGRPGRFADGDAILEWAIAWAYASGIATPEPVWIVTHEDPETEEATETPFTSEPDALAEADDREIDPATIRRATQPVLVGAAADAWRETFGEHVPANTAIECANRYVATHDPSIDGLWWSDAEGFWSAPRGGILPHRLGAWHLVDAPDDEAG